MSYLGWFNKVSVMLGMQPTPVQVGALPMRVRDGEIELCLVTSRGGGRWIIPKGWPKSGRPHHVTAAEEAYEEAGLRGDISDQPIGVCRFRKGIEPGIDMTIRLEVFLLRHVTQTEDWPEKGQRKIRWFDPGTAADKTGDAGLRRLLADVARRADKLVR